MEAVGREMRPRHGILLAICLIGSPHAKLFLREECFAFLWWWWIQSRELSAVGREGCWRNCRLTWNILRQGEVSVSMSFVELEDGKRIIIIKRSVLIAMAWWRQNLPALQFSFLCQVLIEKTISSSEENLQRSGLLNYFFESRRRHRLCGRNDQKNEDYNPSQARVSDPRLCWPQLNVMTTSSHHKLASMSKPWISGRAQSDR